MEITQRIAKTSPQFKARTAGFFWLMTIMGGSLALFVGGDLGQAANIVSTVCYIAATLLVYYLLKPVNRSLSLLAACFSLVGCTLGLARMFLIVLAQVGTISFAFFGLHCLLVGYLIFRSTFLPRFVGALMAIGGFGWLILGLSSTLSPALGRSLSPYILIPGILGEVSLTLWLLVKGINVTKWEEKAGVL
ncbi:DUF4386 domain-containing protein [bacterium]|nr:DUF4386 domain-containing protein [bacterium]